MAIFHLDPSWARTWILEGQQEVICMSCLRYPDFTVSKWKEGHQPRSCCHWGGK